MGAFASAEGFGGLRQSLCVANAKSIRWHKPHHKVEFLARMLLVGQLLQNDASLWGMGVLRQSVVAWVLGAVYCSVARKCSPNAILAEF